MLSKLQRRILKKIRNINENVLTKRASIGKKYHNDYIVDRQGKERRKKKNE